MSRLRILWFCLLFIGYRPTYAQRHINGQSGVGLVVGGVDRLPGLSAFPMPGNGYTGAIEYVWYRKNERYWKASLAYVSTYNRDAPAVVKPGVRQYWLALDYVPRGLYTTRRWLYVAPTVGLYAGYESVNPGQPTSDDGNIYKSTASVGPQLGIEAELYVGTSVALVGGLTERYIPFSQVARFRTTGYIGIRYCFFR